MRLRQLEYFVAVAEEHHFGRAAERLRVAQPGVSQQIKLLERSLGAKLFIRGSDGVQLTEAGGALLDHARLVLELADRTSEIPRLVTNGKAGLLKVGTAAIHVHPVANRIIADFRERFPLVDLQLHPGLGIVPGRPPASADAGRDVRERPARGRGWVCGTWPSARSRSGRRFRRTTGWRPSTASREPSC